MLRLLTARRCRLATLVLGALAGTAVSRLHAQGPEARLEGRVILRGTGTPVPAATVGVEGTTLATQSDSLGRWTLPRVPAGPQVLNVRRLGYAPVRVPLTVPTSGTRTLDIVMATSALQLEQVTVTADRAGRARGELGTASVIDRDAIANQVASSLQGVLELVPGVLLQPPGLDAAAQFSLRSLAVSGTGGIGGAGGPSAADIGAAGTLIVLDGVPLSNNANLQTVGTRGETVPPASTAGGGIDLRRIPAATLERVEVIRGIPSARWGDLTQGAIIVDTRAAATPPEFLGRLDPRTGEGSLVGGRGWSDERQALTLSANLAQTAATRTLSSATTLRGAAQLAHRYQWGEAPMVGPPTLGARPRPRLTLDTRADWYRLRYEAPERPDIEVGRNSFQDDQGLRVSERARLALAGGTLELTAAYDAQAQDTRETRSLSRPTLPFTDRTTEGRATGRYIQGQYLAAYTLTGAPRLLYSRLEWERSRNDRGARSLGIGQLRAGTELRREWNGGAGYAFALDAPPQISFNGVNGFDRPRPFRDVPPLVTSALYADTRLTARYGQLTAELQPGVRLDVLHEGGSWASGARATMPQPRLSAQVSPRPWVRVRGGMGVVSKLPTLGQLFPAQQYFDIVNVNRFTPDPAERLAVLTTFIRDPTNADLRMSRAVKQEAGIELDGGRRIGSLSVTWFDDAIDDAVTLRRDPTFVLRDRYTLADTARGSGRPGRIVDPPIGADSIPVFIDRAVNAGRLGTRGVEFTVALPEVPWLHTRIEATGAVLETRFRTDDRDFGAFNTVTTFVTDTAIKRIAYFAGPRQRAERALVTWRAVHHQPDLGLVITAVAQQLRTDRRRNEGRRDSLSFEGYVTRGGSLVPVPESDRLRPEFADLRRARAGTGSGTSDLPSDWLLSLQVVKSLPANGRLSFYVFNALDKLLTVSGGGVRQFPSTRFGAELTLQTSPFLAGLFGSAK